MSFLDWYNEVMFRGLVIIENLLKRDWLFSEVLLHPIVTDHLAVPSDAFPAGFRVQTIGPWV